MECDRFGLEVAGLTHADAKSRMMLQSRDLTIQVIAGMDAIVIDRRFVSQEIATRHLVTPNWKVTWNWRPATGSCARRPAR